MLTQGQGGLSARWMAPSSCPHPRRSRLSSSSSSSSSAVVHPDSCYRPLLWYRQPSLATSSCHSSSSSAASDRADIIILFANRQRGAQFEHTTQPRLPPTRRSRNGFNATHAEIVWKAVFVCFLSSPALETTGPPGSGELVVAPLQVAAVVESATGVDQSGDVHEPAPAPALMEQVVAATDVSDWGDGKRCQLLGCSQSLLQCNGHVLCAPCLTKWFPSQAGLREDANELREDANGRNNNSNRRLCPVCKVELREVRGDTRFQYGLLKIRETWD